MIRRQKGGDVIIVINKFRHLKYPASKWLKHNVLLKNEELHPYLPETKVLTAESAADMLTRYHLLYVKPTSGGGGKGVIRIERKDGIFYMQTEQQVLKLKKRRSVWIYLQKKVLPKKRYLIQQGLRLLRIDDRPVDFRVILVKPEPNSEWEYKGLIGKHAAKNSHITNRSSGGSPIRFFEALQQGFQYDEEQCALAEETLKSLSLQIATTLGDHFVYMDQLGLDLAIDEEERIWLIEANTRPNYQLFREHEVAGLFAHIRAQIRKLRKPKMNSVRKGGTR